MRRGDSRKDSEQRGIGVGVGVTQTPVKSTGEVPNRSTLDLSSSIEARPYGRFKTFRSAKLTIKGGARCTTARNQ